MACASGCGASSDRAAVDAGNPGAVADAGSTADAGSVGEGGADDSGSPAVPSGPAYYVSTSGADSNDGMSASTPWQTLGKLDAMIAAGAFQQGATVVLRRGDVFRDDYLRISNAVTAPGAASPIGKLSISAYGHGANPILDGADPIACTAGWKADPAEPGVYDCITTQQPSKLYVDATNDGDVEPLLLVPNGSAAPAAWANKTSYELGDVVTDGTDASGAPSYWMAVSPGGNASADGLNPAHHRDLWQGVAPVGGADFQQQLVPTNDARKNLGLVGGGSVTVGVRSAGSGFTPSASIPFTADCGPTGALAGEVKTSATGAISGFTLSHDTGCTQAPTFKLTGAGTGKEYALSGHLDKGSWFESGNADGTWTLSVHAQDNSSPAAHTVVGTMRPYGVSIQSVSNVSISELQVARVGVAGIVDQAYWTGATGTFTGDDLVVENVNLFNVGGVESSLLYAPATAGGKQTRLALGGGIVVASSNYPGATSTQLIKGVVIRNVGCNRVDSPYGVHGSLGCIRLVGTDQFEVTQSYLRSVDAAGFVMGNWPGVTTINAAGHLADNEVTDNADGNVFYGGTVGGLVEHNWIHDSFGEGIQLGGGESGSTYAYNVIANLGASSAGGGYNGFDCNGGNSGSHWEHNTVINVAGNPMSFEGVDVSNPPGTDCTSSHVHDNFTSNVGYAYQGPDGHAVVDADSGLVYFTSLSHTKDVDWSHNAYTVAPGSSRYFNNFHAGEYYDCSTFFTAWPDSPGSFCTPPATAADFATVVGLTNGSNLLRSQADFSPLSTSPLHGAASDGTDIGALQLGETSVFGPLAVGANANDVP